MSPDTMHEPEPPSLGERAAEILPGLDLLAEQLQADTGEALPDLATMQSRIGLAASGAEGDRAELERERGELLRFARRAVEALRQCQGMEIRLMPEEEIGVQALLAFTVRPAILIQKDRFAEPPPAWAELGLARRSEIETALRSVGRLEVSGHPSPAGAGTVWVVAPGLLLTSREVVDRFAVQEAGSDWRIREGLAARIDFGRELGAPPDEKKAFEVREDEPIRVHPETGLALLPVARTSRGGDAELPPPLPFAAKDEVREGRRVYLAGHPMRDERPSGLLRYRLFQGIFDVKRLLPGKVVQVHPGAGTFLHDGSTIGSLSGSPVIDLETNRVVGLHAAGIHGAAGLAVALWRLADDPLLSAARLRS